MELLENLKKRGYLKNKLVEKAFLEISRRDFVLDGFKDQASEDMPLPIGFNQTISQPAVVAFMLELLEAEKGNRVLDIGAGSGWTSSLLANIVGKEGLVVGIERIPELKKFAENNISKYNFIEKGLIQIHLDDGYQGFSEHAPYDRILVSAAIEQISDLPESWINQLSDGGIIVVPVGSFIYKIIKKGQDLLEEKHFGFVFVPLVKKDE